MILRRRSSSSWKPGTVSSSPFDFAFCSRAHASDLSASTFSSHRYGSSTGAVVVETVAEPSVATGVGAGDGDDGGGGLDEPQAASAINRKRFTARTVRGNGDYAATRTSMITVPPGTRSEHAEKDEGPLDERALKTPAASYSPTGLPLQYH